MIMYRRIVWPRHVLESEIHRPVARSALLQTTAAILSRPVAAKQRVPPQEEIVLLAHEAFPHATVADLHVRTLQILEGLAVEEPREIPRTLDGAGGEKMKDEPFFKSCLPCALSPRTDHPIRRADALALRTASDNLVRKPPPVGRAPLDGHGGRGAEESSVIPMSASAISMSRRFTWSRNLIRAHFAGVFGLVSEAFSVARETCDMCLIRRHHIDTRTLPPFPCHSFPPTFFQLRARNHFFLYPVPTQTCQKDSREKYRKNWMELRGKKMRALQQSTMGKSAVVGKEQHAIFPVADDMCDMCPIRRHHIDTPNSPLPLRQHFSNCGHGIIFSFPFPHRNAKKTTVGNTANVGWSWGKKNNSPPWESRHESLGLATYPPRRQKHAGGV